MIIKREYRKDVPENQAEIFFRLVKFWGANERNRNEDGGNGVVHDVRVEWLPAARLLDDGRDARARRVRLQRIAAHDDEGDGAAGDGDAVACFLRAERVDDAESIRKFERSELLRRAVLPLLLLCSAARE